MRATTSFAILFLHLLLFTSITECQNATLLSILLDISQWLYSLVFGLSPVGVDLPPDIQAQLFMEPTMRIALQGFTAENHTVTTSDGYNLNFYRIPNTSSEAITILLMHGLSCSSDQYILALNSSMAFQLYQQGFDIWLGNWRGSPYSNHTTYTRQDQQFWNYSFEDMAEKDLPTAIDYILDATGKSKLVYVGHSMGTIVGFLFFSSHPEYNSKVSSFIALSPVPNLRYATMTAGFILTTGEITMPLVEAAGQYSFLAFQPDLINSLVHICANPDNYALCELYLSLIAGWNPYYHNQTRLPIYFVAMCTGSSTKNFKHFSQLARFNCLRRFDYGLIENQNLYNSTIPPKFDLSTIKVPTFLHAGPNDSPSASMAVTFGLAGMKAAHFEPISNTMYTHFDQVVADNTGPNLILNIVSNIQNTYYNN